MKLTVKSAVKADLEDVMILLHVLYKGDVGSQLANIVEEYIDSDRHIVFVGFHNDSPVGILIGTYRLDIDYECRVGFVDAIVVDENMRQQGIGKRLMEEFSGWAKHRDCTVLQVLNGNRTFFEGIGFEERPARLHQIPIERIENITKRCS